MRIALKSAPFHRIWQVYLKDLALIVAREIKSLL